MEFTKKFRLTVFIIAGVLVLSIAACLAMGGVSLSSEYSGGVLKTSDLLRDALICTVGGMVLLFALLAMRSKAAAGGAGAIVLLINAAVVSALTCAIRLPIFSSLLSVLLLTIGLSVYSSMVLFRQIRENIAADQQADRHIAGIVDMSTRDCMPRLIGPSLIIALIAILICVLGGSSLIPFALPTAIASIVCAYTSVFLTAAIWAKLTPEPAEKAKKAKTNKKKSTKKKK